MREFTREIRKVRQLLLVVVCAGCTAADADGTRRRDAYRPSSQLERLQPAGMAGDDIGLVRDFDMAGDTVYLLDMTGRIAVVARTGGEFILAGHIGRSGDGPGELRRPSGLAVTGSGIVVADGTRLHFFSRSGAPLGMKWMRLPCAMSLPSVAPAADGLFVHGDCLRAGYVTDTMKAVLAWSQDTASWEVILETPRYTRDGSIGSVFGAVSLLTTGQSGTHAFGGGEHNCIWSIDEHAGRPSAREVCPAVATLYSAAPPPGLEARLRAGAVAGMKVRWPESLPIFRDRFVGGTTVVLMRPFTADSVVLQTAAPGGADIAVAPLDGLIGCKAAGCLWVLENDEVPRIIMLDRASIERRLRLLEER